MLGGYEGMAVVEDLLFSRAEFGGIPDTTEDGRVSAAIGDSCHPLEPVLEIFPKPCRHRHDGSPGAQGELGSHYLHLSVQKLQPLEDANPHGLARLVESSLALRIQLVCYLAE